MPPRTTTVLRSPKDAANQPVKLVIPAVTVAPVKQMQLMWDYPADQLAQVQFEVWFSTSLISGPPLAQYDSIPTGFQLSVVVDHPPVIIQSNLPQQFFIVRAKNRVTGVYSYWNQRVAVNPVSLTSPISGTVSNTITLSSEVNTPLITSPGGIIVTPQ
jgi:hypothetical protein